MEPVLLGAAGGLVVGFIVGFTVGKGTLKKFSAEYEARLKETQQKLESAKKEAGAHLEKERGRAVAAEKKLAELTEQKAALEKSIEQHKAQAKQMQIAITESENLRTKLSSQAEALTSARQQAEGRAKQAETAANQAQRALDAAQGQLKKLQGQLGDVQETAERRSREVQKLRGELKRGAAGASGLEESVKSFSQTDGSLDSILTTLLDEEGQRAAVLADANGIIVAAVGEAGLKEGMAATSHLVGSMCTQLVDMVPFSSIRSYALQDTQANVIAGRAFVCQGETVGLVTYGPRVPSDRVLDGAMASLGAALE